MITCNYTIYVHNRKIWNLFLRVLEPCTKESIWWAFLASFVAVQINLIYSDIICIMCVSCNVKKSKTTAVKLSTKNRNNRRSYRFQLCPLQRPCVWCYRFCLCLYMNKVPVNRHCQWPNNADVYLTVFLVLKITRFRIKLDMYIRVSFWFILLYCIVKCMSTLLHVMYYSRGYNYRIIGIFSIAKSYKYR